MSMYRQRKGQGGSYRQLAELSFIVRWSQIVRPTIMSWGYECVRQKTPQRWLVITFELGRLPN